MTTWTPNLSPQFSNPTFIIIGYVYTLKLFILPKVLGCLKFKASERMSELTVDVRLVNVLSAYSQRLCRHGVNVVNDNSSPLPISYSLFTIPHFPLPLPIPYSLFPIPDSPFYIPHSNSPLLTTYPPLPTAPHSPQPPTPLSLPVEICHDRIPLWP